MRRLAPPFQIRHTLELGATAIAPTSRLSSLTASCNARPTFLLERIVCPREDKDLLSGRHLSARARPIPRDESRVSDCSGSGFTTNCANGRSMAPALMTTADRVVRRDGGRGAGNTAAPIPLRSVTTNWPSGQSPRPHPCPAQARRAGGSSWCVSLGCRALRLRSSSLLGVPTSSRAQELLASSGDGVEANEQALTPVPAGACDSVRSAERRPAALLPLYASFVTLQVLDIALDAIRPRPRRSRRRTRRSKG